MLEWPGRWPGWIRKSLPRFAPVFARGLALGTAFALGDTFALALGTAGLWLLRWPVGVALVVAVALACGRGRNMEFK